MNVQVTHVIVHSPEQTREILREALSIAEDLSCNETEWAAIFTQSCQLLGQRYTLALTPEPAPIALPHLAIPGGRH